MARSAARRGGHRGLRRFGPPGPGATSAAGPGLVLGLGPGCPALLHHLPRRRAGRFHDGPAKFLFDLHGGSRAERTVLVVARPQRPTERRDTAYQAGYPLGERRGARPFDRGHFVPYSGGGQFGPNIFAQDRALNRGWSRQGRLYRALETRAVAAHDAVLVARPHYVDDSEVPALLDLGVGDELGWEVRRFRNRYDLPVGPEQVELAVLLNGATSAQIGALGEETAATYLADELGATLVAMGDASMPRNGADPGPRHRGGRGRLARCVRGQDSVSDPYRRSAYAGWESGPAPDASASAARGREAGQPGATSRRAWEGPSTSTAGMPASRYVPSPSTFGSWSCSSSS